MVVGDEDEELGGEEDGDGEHNLALLLLVNVVPVPVVVEEDVEEVVALPMNN